MRDFFMGENILMFGRENTLNITFSAWELWLGSYRRGGGAAKNKRYLFRIITKSTKGGWNLFKLVDKQNNFM